MTFYEEIKAKTMNHYIMVEKTKSFGRMPEMETMHTHTNDLNLLIPLKMHFKHDSTDSEVFPKSE